MGVEGGQEERGRIVEKVRGKAGEQRRGKKCTGAIGLN
jgi:hypothetical protein